MTSNYKVRLAFMIGCCALAGCGGGGGGGSKLVSAPPPPAPPPPPPSPPNANVPFNETIGVTFSGLSDGFSGDFTVTRASDGNYVISTFDQRDFQVGPGTNDYAFKQVSPGMFAMDVHGFGGSTFTMTDGGGQFTRASTAVGQTEIFQLGKPGALANLTYSNFGNYSWIEANGAGVGQGYISFLTLGNASTDRPIVGTASYTGAADGLWDDGTTVRRLFGSEVSLIANFGTGTLQTTLNLIGRGDPFGNFMAATATPLGIFTGTGALSSSAAASFAGSFNLVNSYTGTFNGLFYGPEAVEFGYLFSLSNGAGGRATGVAVGKKP